MNKSNTRKKVLESHSRSQIEENDYFGRLLQDPDASESDVVPRALGNRRFLDLGNLVKLPPGTWLVPGTYVGEDRMHVAKGCAKDAFRKLVTLTAADMRSTQEDSTQVLFIIICRGWNCTAGMLNDECFAAKEFCEARLGGNCVGGRRVFVSVLKHCQTRMAIVGVCI